MEAHPLYKGRQREILALVRKQRPVFEDDLYHAIPQATKNKIDELIKFLADATLPITNRRISRKLAGYDHIYELKPKDVRLFYFQYGNDFYHYQRMQEREEERKSAGYGSS